MTEVCRRRRAETWALAIVLATGACTDSRAPDGALLYDYAVQRPAFTVVQSPSARGGRLPAWRKDGWVQPPGTRVAHVLRVPGGGRLEVVPTLVGATPLGNDEGLTVRVLVRPDGAMEEARFSGRISGSVGSRVTVDLADLAGQRVEIAFAVDEDTGGRLDRAIAWVRPRLWGDAGGRDLTTNVILLDIDTLRADHVAVYGGLERTPNLDRIARGGALFARAYAQIPITGPSHASMFTSRYPGETAVHNNVQLLDARFPVLAEEMRESYRATAAVVSLGVLQGRFGFARGFDRYFDDFARNDWWRDAGAVNEQVVPWIREHRDGPFFLWVHYSDPHSPYAPPGFPLPSVELRAGSGVVETFPADGRRRTFALSPGPGPGEIELTSPGAGEQRFELQDVDLGGPSLELATSGWETRETLWGPEYTGTLPVRFRFRAPEERESVSFSFRIQESLSTLETRRRYAKEVEYVDREIGRLLRELESLGLGGRTLLVVTSDHGEGLGDHGEIGHVDQLYESQIRVPLLVSFPGRVRPGTVVAAGPARLVDLLPTTLDLLHLEESPGAQGRSLLPLLEGAPGEPRVAPGFTYRPEARSTLESVVGEEGKYIRNDDNGTEELYLLEEDPGELRNRIEDLPERAMSARGHLSRMSAGPAGPTPAPADLDEDERARLRALGYVH